MRRGCGRPLNTPKRNWTNCSSLTFGKRVPSQLCPWRASSISQFPLLGLTSAQALFRPLSPDSTSPPPALAPPELSSPLRKMSSGSAPSSAAPHFQLGPALLRPAPPHSTPLHLACSLGSGSPAGPAPAPGPGPLPARLAWAPTASAPPRAPATRRLPAGPARPTQAPRSQSAAATLRPEPGWGVGTSGCRSAWARRASAGTGCVVVAGLRSPRRAPTLPAAPNLTS